MSFSESSNDPLNFLKRPVTSDILRYGAEKKISEWSGLTSHFAPKLETEKTMKKNKKKCDIFMKEY